MALNLENEIVGILIFGSDINTKNRNIIKHTISIVNVHVGRTLLGHVVDALGIFVDGTNS